MLTNGLCEFQFAIPMSAGRIVSALTTAETRSVYREHWEILVYIHMEMQGSLQQSATQISLQYASRVNNLARIVMMHSLLNIHTSSTVSGLKIKLCNANFIVYVMVICHVCVIRDIG
jgi:hypothetical protein